MLWIGPGTFCMPNMCAGLLQPCLPSRLIAGGRAVHLIRYHSILYSPCCILNQFTPHSVLNCLKHHVRCLVFNFIISRWKNQCRGNRQNEFIPLTFGLGFQECRTKTWKDAECRTESSQEVDEYKMLSVWCLAKHLSVSGHYKSEYRSALQRS